MMIKRSAIGLSNIDKVVIAQDQQKQIFENIEIDTVKKGISWISLGLAFCKIAVEAQRGMLAITPNQLHGYIFINDIQSLRFQESKHEVLYSLYIILLFSFFLFSNLLTNFIKGRYRYFWRK